MNQILLTDNDNNKKKKNNKNISRNNSNDIKKIIVFFSVVILVFGIAIGGVYGYRLLRRNQEETTISKPEVSLQELEQEEGEIEEVTIIAKSKIGISKIIYTWNNAEEQVKELNGRTSHEEKIQIPYGESILKVTVIDQNGEEIETTKEFTREAEKPTIELDKTIGNGKVKIIATDETSKMKYITYKWNDEEETTIEAQGEDTVIETIIDVKRGKNKLTINAVNMNDVEEIIEETLNGVNNPEIKVTKRDNKLYMKVTHDMGFEKIEFYVNGTIYTYDKNFSGYDAAKQEIEYYFNLKEGENIVIIHAISNETIETEEGIKNIETIYKGKCNYTTE